MSKYIALLFCGCLVACSGIKVLVDDGNQFDPRANESFAWLWEPMKINAARISNDAILDKVIRARLDEKLQSKGYQPTTKGSADFLVSYTFLRQPLHTLSPGKAATTDPTEVWVSSGRIGDNTLYSYQSLGVYERGSLMVILEDKSGKVIWQGAVSKMIEYQELDESRVNSIADKALDKLLAHLPNKQ
jgi:Domain of unknown function (DUF4136)